jgi:hypothetical protein
MLHHLFLKDTKDSGMANLLESRLPGGDSENESTIVGQDQLVFQMRGRFEHFRHFICKVFARACFFG